MGLALLDILQHVKTPYFYSPWREKKASILPWVGQTKNPLASQLYNRIHIALTRFLAIRTRFMRTTRY